MTEKAAWSLARDKELDMVVINPAIVLGPKVFGTTQSIFTYLKGKKILSNFAQSKDTSLQGSVHYIARIGLFISLINTCNIEQLVSFQCEY